MDWILKEKNEDRWLSVINKNSIQLTPLKSCAFRFKSRLIARRFLYDSCYYGRLVVRKAKK